MDAQIMRPKVLVLTKLFWPEGGGAELATYLIVKEVLSKGFDVVVVSGTRRPKSDVLRAVDYVHWSALESKYKPVEWLRLLANTRWFTKLVERADVVYIPSHTLIPMAMVAKLVKPKRQGSLALTQLPSARVHFDRPSGQRSPTRPRTLSSSTKSTGAC